MKKEFAPFIYGLYDSADAGHIRYVGMAGSRAERPHDHAKLARRSKKNSHLMNWIRQVQASGREPLVLVLEQLSVGARLSFVGEIEKMHISSLRGIGHRLTNVSEGGEGRTGAHTAATRAKISQSHIGKAQASPSQETRDRISKANTGKKRAPRSAEWRANLSAGKRGRTHVVSPGTGAHISESLRAAWARRKIAGTAKDSPESVESKRLAGLKRVSNETEGDRVKRSDALKVGWIVRRARARALDLMVGEA